MFVRLAVLPVVACCTFSGMSAASARTPAVYSLVERRAVGDVYLSDQKWHLAFTARPSVEGKPLPPSAITHDEIRVYRACTLGVDAKGRATAERWTYLKARNVDSEDNRPEKTSVRSVEGATLTLKRVKDKTSVVSTTRALSKDDREWCTDALQSCALSPLPSQPVAVGKPWILDGKVVAETFSLRSARMTGRLVSIEQYHGYRCARLHVVLCGDVTVPGLSAPVMLRLEGNMHYALGLHHTIGGEMSGPVHGKGSVKTGDQVVQLALAGEMTWTAQDLPAKRGR